MRRNKQGKKERRQQQASYAPGAAGTAAGVGAGLGLGHLAKKMRGKFHQVAQTRLNAAQGAAEHLQGAYGPHEAVRDDERLLKSFHRWDKAKDIAGALGSRGGKAALATTLAVPGLLALNRARQKNKQQPTQTKTPPQKFEEYATYIVSLGEQICTMGFGNVIKPIAGKSGELLEKAGLRMAAKGRKMAKTPADYEEFSKGMDLQHRGGMGEFRSRKNREIRDRMSK